MKTLAYRAVFCVFILAGLVVSCKKQSSSSLQNQKISAIDYGNQQSLLAHYVIKYDRTNRVDSIIGTDFTNSDHHFYSKFFYDAGDYIVVREDKYSIHTWLNSVDTMVVTTNANSKISELYASDSTDTLYLNYNYFEVTKVSYDSSGPGAPYDRYVWSNDANLDSVISKNNLLLETYSYDVSKNSSNLDGIGISQFLRYGQAYVTPRNLVTRCTYSPQSHSDFKYTFDKSARITQLKIFRTWVDSGVAVQDTSYYNYSY